jgi:hypothetical protein
MLIIFFAGYVATYSTGPLSAVNDSMTSTPYTILFCASVGASLLVFPRANGKVRQGVYPGLFRRYFAANIDIAIAVFLVFSFMFPILLLIENTAREEWVWSWETAASPFYLFAFIFGTLSCFVGIYFYFRIHLERGRATPGQYIMGYKVVPVGPPKYNRRIWNGLFYFWLWIIAWSARTETEGVYTWDKNSNSQAVRVE